MPRERIGKAIQEGCDAVSRRMVIQGVLVVASVSVGCWCHERMDEVGTKRKQRMTDLYASPHKLTNINFAKCSKSCDSICVDSFRNNERDFC